MEYSKISESAFAKHSARVSRAWGHSRHDASTSAVSDMMYVAWHLQHGSMMFVLGKDMEGIFKASSQTEAPGVQVVNQGTAPVYLHASDVGTNTRIHLQKHRA